MLCEPFLFIAIKHYYPSRAVVVYFEVGINYNQPPLIMDCCEQCLCYILRLTYNLTPHGIEITYDKLGPYHCIESSKVQQKCVGKKCIFQETNRILYQTSWACCHADTAAVAVQRVGEVGPTGDDSGQPWAGGMVPFPWCPPWETLMEKP